MTRQKEIIVANGAQGWAALFKNFSDMPCDVWLPLPYTSKAASDIVVLETSMRFPGAEVWSLTA